MKVPKHVGIILDGNRRFSKRLMMKPWKGHEWGAKKVQALFDWCKELGIKELTLYTFSVENFNRPKKEFDYLMDLFKKEFDSLKDDPKIHENKIVRIRNLIATELVNFLCSPEWKNLRQCKECSNFWLARTNRVQQYCSDRCRIKYHNRARSKSGKNTK